MKPRSFPSIFHLSFANIWASFRVKNFIFASRKKAAPCGCESLVIFWLRNQKGYWEEEKFEGKAARAVESKDNSDFGSKNNSFRIWVKTFNLLIEFHKQNSLEALHEKPLKFAEIFLSLQLIHMSHKLLSATA